MARILLAKKYEKITNQRDYFLHKVANKYVTSYGAIYIEDVNINNTDKNHENHPDTKIVEDASWGKFFELLNYKAEEAGRSVIKVPYSEITGETCSACGAINSDLAHSDTEWKCKICGVLLDRANNTAKNICRVGQTL
jgi:putative transposase